MVLQTANASICLQALRMHNLYDREEMVSKKTKSDVTCSVSSVLSLNKQERFLTVSVNC